jgi:aspartate 1-decarboxylase
MFKSRIHRATVTHGNLQRVAYVDRDNRIVAVDTDPAESVPGVIHVSAIR